MEEKKQGQPFNDLLPEGVWEENGNKKEEEEIKPVVPVGIEQKLKEESLSLPQEGESKRDEERETEKEEGEGRTETVSRSGEKEGPNLSPPTSLAKEGKNKETSPSRSLSKINILKNKKIIVGGLALLGLASSVLFYRFYYQQGEDEFFKEVQSRPEVVLTEKEIPQVVPEKRIKKNKVQEVQKKKKHENRLTKIATVTEKFNSHRKITSNVSKNKKQIASPQLKEEKVVGYDVVTNEDASLVALKKEIKRLELVIKKLKLEKKKKELEEEVKGNGQSLSVSVERSHFQENEIINAKIRRLRDMVNALNQKIEIALKNGNRLLPPKVTSSSKEEELPTVKLIGVSEGKGGNIYVLLSVNDKGKESFLRLKVGEIKNGFEVRRCKTSLCVFKNGRKVAKFGD